MADRGWVKIHRKIQDNPIWRERPFSKGQAMIDLILLANHAGQEVLIGNQIIHLERGQVYTSESKLAERWGWSRNKVRAFALLLQNQKFSTAQGTTKGTTITIENYALYQDSQTTEDTATPTSEGQQKVQHKNIKRNTNKNVKNEKNVKNNSPPIVPPLLWVRL